MTTQFSIPVLSEPKEAHYPSIGFQCPVCKRPIATVSGLRPASCSRCGFTISVIDGIHRALASDRKQHFSHFISDYQTVRQNEGRGSDSADYYLSLPFRDLTGHNSWQWSIRARTFNCLLKRIMPRIEAEHPGGADILDIGAGNGWLSYRLALRGHRPTAVDLIDNDADGLGAARHYLDRLAIPFPRIQAEMDNLPFLRHQFDVAIFNAALHYSSSYLATLTEVLRCLRRPGYLIIADSPWYGREESGQRMVEEKRADFQRRFGFPSDSLRSEEFLTDGKLACLARDLQLRWRIEKPWYGLRWALRPLKARLLGRREPSKFHVFWTKVDA